MCAARRGRASPPPTRSSIAGASAVDSPTTRSAARLARSTATICSMGKRVELLPAGRQRLDDRTEQPRLGVRRQIDARDRHRPASLGLVDRRERRHVARIVRGHPATDGMRAMRSGQRMPHRIVERVDRHGARRTMRLQYRLAGLGLIAEAGSRQCERARVRRDRRYDGCFFSGVRTTGIYCRPVCPVRPAQGRTSTFYPTAAAAEAAGFRPACAAGRRPRRSRRPGRARARRCIVPCG